MTFGVYEQDWANGDEPIEWYVLDKSDSEATLLSVTMLENMPYHDSAAPHSNITWENCSLRTWLNEDFYNSAFNEEEAAMILRVDLTNEDNPFCDDVSGEKDTSDQVWLLSLQEIEKYFGIPMTPESNPLENETLGQEDYALYCYHQDSRILAKPTSDVKAGMTHILNQRDVQSYETDGYDFSHALGCGWWWLRSPGIAYDHTAFVERNGSVQYCGISLYSKCGVRPVIKVSY